MIISVRGAFGSGKSTLVRSVLEKFGGKPIYGALGPKRPEAYECKVPKVKKPVYILGPYLVATGGCDMVRPYDTTLDLIERYGAQGNVLFEGVLISSSFGRVGELMSKWGQEAVCAFMDTPLEVCINHVKKRRAAKKDVRDFDPKNVIIKFKQVEISRRSITAAGRVRVVDLNMKTGHDALLKLFRSAA